MKNTNADGGRNKMMSYKMFSVMMIISFLMMYAAMFLNVDDVSHIFLNPRPTGVIRVGTKINKYDRLPHVQNLY